MLEQCEGDGDIKYHAGESGPASLVEALHALSFRDCFRSIPLSIELLRLQALHAGPDNFNGLFPSTGHRL